MILKSERMRVSSTTLSTQTPFFPLKNPIGQTIKIAGAKYVVTDQPNRYTMTVRRLTWADKAFKAITFVALSIIVAIFMAAFVVGLVVFVAWSIAAIVGEALHG